MRKFAAVSAIGALLATVPTASASAAPERAVPYWASIAAGQARMRTGPGRNFPATWLYQRVDLPVKVIETYPSWRKVEDPDGTQGWMMVNLLSDQRTAIITGEVRPLRVRPEGNAPIVWRAEPGVVGHISSCAAGWCEFSVRGRNGYIEIAHIWGVSPGESVD